jgi:hypothetical protein
MILQLIIMHTSYLTLTTVIGIIINPTDPLATIPASKLSLFDNTGKEDFERSCGTVLRCFKKKRRRISDKVKKYNADPGTFLINKDISL